MKFVHIADMHFDIPFTTLNKNNLGNLRRLEQRQVFKQIIEYIKQNNIDNLFICGDLYEHEYVKQSTIEYINNLFKEIPNTHIYIVPGNHDPKIKNSYYNKYNWSSNVHIFGEKIERISTKNIDIYGYGFNDFYMKNTQINEIQIENPNKINILLTHGTVDGTTESDNNYNPMSKRELKELNFNYIALGHIHKPEYNTQEEIKIVYPGSTISMGFDELGKHGMIVGEILENKKINIEFIPLDKKEFVEYKLEIDPILSKEELIEIINEIQIESNKYYKIILRGRRNFEIDKYDIQKYIISPNIIKIKDNTNIKIDLKELSEQNSLKGIFVKNMLEKLNDNPENKEVILKAIEIGLEAM